MHIYAALDADDRAGVAEEYNVPLSTSLPGFALHCRLSGAMEPPGDRLGRLEVDVESSILPHPAPETPGWQLGWISQWDGMEKLLLHGTISPILSFLV